MPLIGTVIWSRRWAAAIVVIPTQQFPGSLAESIRFGMKSGGVETLDCPGEVSPAIVTEVFSLTPHFRSSVARRSDAIFFRTGVVSWFLRLLTTLFRSPVLLISIRLNMLLLFLLLVLGTF